MKQAIFLLTFVLLYSNANDNSITIELSDTLEWNSILERSYQLEKSNDGSNWDSIGPTYIGNDSKKTHKLNVADPSIQYRIVETIPGILVPETNIPNSNFESSNLVNWSTGGTHPPNHSNTYSKNGIYSARFLLPGGQNESILYSDRISGIQAGESYSLNFWAKKVDSGPSLILQYRVQWFGSTQSDTGFAHFNIENNVWQNVVIQNLNAPSGSEEAIISFRFVTGAVSGAKGDIYIDDIQFSSGLISTPDQTQTQSIFPIKHAHISFPTLDKVNYTFIESENLFEWEDKDTIITGDGNLKSISFPANSLSKFIRIVRPDFDLLPPTNASASISLNANSVDLSWAPSPTPTIDGYRIYYGPEINQLNQSLNVGPITNVTISNLINDQEYYFKIFAIEGEKESLSSTEIFSSTPIQTFNLVPLFNESTEREEETTIDHEEALITYVGDRGRARHAKEGHFQLYDIYKEFYWMGRTYYLEIIDRVAKGGNSITINSTTSHPLITSETRAFYKGGTTLAEYYHNDDAQDGHRTISGALINTNQPMKYTSTVSYNAKEGRPIQIGDRMEIEFSPFMDGLPAGSGGQTNYYGTGFLYIVGEGLKPWYGVGSNLDSYPLPEYAWLGGKTTHHTQYSNEPDHAFKQMAYNLAPANTEKFMLGRRLHHTNFQDGSHSEPNNPVFYSHSNKVGNHFINTSCVSCHTNNGRAIPNPEGSLLTKSIVRVGIDSSATIHPQLGTVLQVRSNSGNPESNIKRSSYTEINGYYGDGTPYSLRSPNYSFSNTNSSNGLGGIGSGGGLIDNSSDPEYYSVRVAPQLVGLGLLEAIDENTIIGFADPNDSNNDGISGRINTLIDIETGETRLGRFGYKASKAKLKHHIASALNTDMGVTTTLYPFVDHTYSTSSIEINDNELDLMYRYVALLALMPQKSFDNPSVLNGKSLFTEANCVACHKEQIETGSYHPLTELRNQTIRPYTDLLLHDMGPGLADNMGEELASGSEWRTAPLWNIGYTEGVSGSESYLHDGRARSLEEAILWHGGEAENAKEYFRNMTYSDRVDLINFIKSL